MGIELCTWLLQSDFATWQVEFYFSDSNLPKDIFLKKQVAAHPEGCKLSIA
jgi:hypothetical protein